MKLSRCHLTLVALSIAWVAPGAAQSIPDHLACSKVKDPQAKAKYTADLGGLITQPGCVMKVPASLLCVEATKTNVMPPPPGGTDDTGAAGRFLCYQVKCAKAAVPTVQWHDQFGMRTLTPSPPRMLCAPEIVVTTTTTTSSTTTTTLCSGFPFMGSCWHLAGAIGTSCDAVCAGLGLSCDETATREVAGSAGSLVHCGAIIDGLAPATAPNPQLAGDNSSCGSPELGFGCSYHMPGIDGGGAAVQSTAPTTTCAATGIGGSCVAGVVRACACQ
jgi:hypothetical protein